MTKVSNMDEGEPLNMRTNVIDGLLTKPPEGYVFLIMASQESHYDLFMSTIIKRAMEIGLTILEVITEARNREIMSDMAKLQGGGFQIASASQ